MPAKSVSLAELLKNPHLIRPSPNINEPVTELSPHEQTLMEEDNDAIFQANLKRSRTDLTAQNHQTAYASSSVTPSPSTTADHHTPTDTNQQSTHASYTRHFLSAEPGKQACRES